MGANIDKNEKSFFIIDKPGWSNGAIATGSPGYAQSPVYTPTAGVAKNISKRFTWLVCPHLSQPDFVYRASYHRSTPVLPVYRVITMQRQIRRSMMLKLVGQRLQFRSGLLVTVYELVAVRELPGETASRVS